MEEEEAEEEVEEEKEEAPAPAGESFWTVSNTNPWGTWNVRRRR